MGDDPYTKAEAAYAALKSRMKEQFSPEHFVAITGGKIVADADSFDGLHAKIRELHLGEQAVLYDQVGRHAMDSPEYPGWIMLEAMAEHWIKCLTPTETA